MACPRRGPSTVYPSVHQPCYRWLCPAQVRWYNYDSPLFQQELEVPVIRLKLYLLKTDLLHVVEVELEQETEAEKETGFKKWPELFGK